MNLWPFRRNRKAAPASPVIHSGGGTQFSFLRNLDINTGEGGYDYRRRVGTGTGASVVMAPVQWVQRSLPEAPLIVEREVAPGEWEPDEAHPLQALLEQPNPFYTGLHLWQATIFSYLTDGNSYWIIVRNGMGRPMALWYVPHWLIRPMAPDDGSEFLTGYEYRVRGRQIELRADQIVHFRHGIDPENPRLGISPIDSAIREIWADMEASEFIASLLRNSGIPGLVISPDDDGGTISPVDPEEIKRYVMERTTGSRRGEPVVMSGKTKIERLAWSPREMDLSPASDRSEERLCALLGIPAAVVGFSAGLEQTKVGATMSELRKLAWMNGIIPLQRNFAGEVDRALIPAFGDTGRRRTRFDTARVTALQEDRNKLFQRIDRGIQGGWISIADGKREVGMEPEPGDEVYLRRTAVLAVPVDAPLVPAHEPEVDDEATPRLPPAKIKQDEPTGLERRLLEHPTRARATEAQLRYMEIQEAALPGLIAAMEDELLEFFGDLADRALAAAEPILEDMFKAAGPEVSIATDRILEAMAMPGIISIFKEVHERQYLRVAEGSTAEAMGAIGLQTNIPDPVARAIQATGGTRAGLVDLKVQTRKALFRAIEEGRALGEGGQALARRIEGLVKAGPWSSAEVRATMIARTETKHAQRMSALVMGRGQGVEQFRVFDARLGLTDATCESLDGIIVSAADAEHLAGDEHPLGTRDFVPHFG